MKIELKPIAYVKNKRITIADDNWLTITSEIELEESIITEAFEGIDHFSHLEIIFYMNKVADEKATAKHRHPRNNEKLPKLGTYAQRNKNRPNKLGLTTVQLIERNGRKIKVKYLDAIDGTPILDIKPVMLEFEPKGEIKQPTWVSEIMNNYW